jgi:transglutaminase/protease-like cytokinesis protein 3
VKDTKDTIAKAAPKPAESRAAPKVSKSSTSAAKQSEGTQDDGADEQAAAPQRAALTKQKSAKKLAPSAAADAVNSADDSTLTTTSTPPRREAPAASAVGKLKKVSSVSANGLASPKAEQVGSEEKKVSEKGSSATQRYKEAVSAKSATLAGGDKEDGNALQKPRRRVVKPASSN